MLRRLAKLIRDRVAAIVGMQPASKRFGVAVAIASIPVLTLAWFSCPLHPTGFELARFIALACLLTITDCFPVMISKESIFLSPAIPISIATIYLYGPFGAAVVSMCGMLSCIFRSAPPGRRGIRKTLRWLGWSCIHNLPMNAVGVALPGLAYQCLIDLHVFPAHSFAAAAALSLAAIGQFYLSAVMVTALACLWSGERWDVVWHNNFRWTLACVALLAPIGFIMGALTEQSLVLGVCFIMLPVIAINRGYALHESQIRTYRSGVEMLGRLMQESHPYTHGHLNRVARWAIKIADGMSLSPESIEHVENAAILHDIGKIAIDDRILNKVEKLTDDEWAKIKQHPVVGAEIAAKMKYLDQVSVWIRHHHERMDGKGYPDGLIGEHIPIESKIICVVDVFDAMVGGPSKADHRPYRKAKTMDEAREELVRCAGTQFDADVVTAFLTVLDQEAEEERELRDTCSPAAPRLTLVSRSSFGTGIDAGSTKDGASLRGAA